MYYALDLSVIFSTSQSVDISDSISSELDSEDADCLITAACCNLVCFIGLLGRPLVEQDSFD